VALKWNTAKLPGVQRSFATPPRYDAVRSLGFLEMKSARGSMVRDGSSVTWASLSPEGPVTVRFDHSAGSITAEAWGAGGQWALDRAPAIAGCEDDLTGFDPASGLVRDLHKRFSGLRLGATGIVWDTLAQAVLGQRVTGKEAKGSYRALVRDFGEAAPGPGGLRTPPYPERIAALTWDELHPYGVERSRATTLIEAARRIDRLQEAVAMSRQDAWTRLQSIKGIGPWTAAAVMGVARGDPDTVAVGDYHVPNTVAWALAGEPRGDDARMLELLKPYRGHRRRVVMLLKSAGVHAPKFGPRQAIQPIAHR
jgi:3-methyladenine DNA glycosylase/8-oxoguanine DNA glycosylase